MRPYNLQSAVRVFRSHSTATSAIRRSTTIPQQLRCRHDISQPPASRFAPRLSRFDRYEDASEDVTTLKTTNPLNYVENERRRLRRNQYYKKRMTIAGVGIAVCIGIQLYIVLTFRDPQAAKEKNGNSNANIRPADGKQRLDAPPGGPSSADQPVVVVSSKPGVPSIKVDELGRELVETGTSTIPHFPRTIRVPSSSASPAATPTSTRPGEGAQEGVEEYQLLGLGIRTVSFLSIQVYVLGMYVRTTDLDKLQAAFVRHVNPAGSSLIASEKESLRNDLMSAERSLEIWDTVLKETGVRSAVRIVPTRGTDFAHLRDGWVRGITARTQDASRKGEGKTEWDEPGFGESVGEFKRMLGGKGKAPKGSVMLLTRDERGVMQALFENEKKTEQEGVIIQRGVGQLMGSLADERISRQVWLGYLGGKNVSSEGARKSIVDGVMDLVARPVGTLGTQVS